MANDIPTRAIEVDGERVEFTHGAASWSDDKIEAAIQKDYPQYREINWDPDGTTVPGTPLEPVEASATEHPEIQYGFGDIGQTRLPAEPRGQENLDIPGEMTFISGQMKYNPLVNIMTNLQQGFYDPLDPDPGYDPYEDFEPIAGYPYEIFARSQSKEETERI